MKTSPQDLIVSCSNSNVDQIYQNWRICRRAVASDICTPTNQLEILYDNIELTIPDCTQ